MNRFTDIAIAREIYGWDYHPTPARPPWPVVRVLAPSEEWLIEQQYLLPESQDIPDSWFVPLYSGSLASAFKLLQDVCPDVMVKDIPGSPNDIADFALAHHRSQKGTVVPVFSDSWVTMSKDQLEGIVKYLQLQTKDGTLITQANPSDPNDPFFNHLGLRIPVTPLDTDGHYHVTDTSPLGQLLYYSIRQSTVASFYKFDVAETLEDSSTSQGTSEEE